ncbi:MAG: hypothetical protein LBG76_00045, partial [Treponema sp.]|nr:hypothetical protein [Treponema sp.]
MITQKIRRFPVIYAVRAFILSPLFVACMANFSAISPEEEALTLNPPEVVESAAPQYAPEIKMLPNKIDYPIGGAVREGDLEVKKRESSGAWTTVAYHTDYRGGNGFSISHSPFTSAGPQTVTITVHNYPDAGQTTSATYQVYVDSPAVQVYATEELQVLPLKTIYDCGASINPAGDVEVYKRDIYGRSITLSYPNEFAVSPITPLTAAGPVPITVLAGGGLFARYEVWVRPEAQSPLLVAAPGKVNYAVGGGIDPAADLAVFKRETDGAMTAVPSGG